MGNVLKLIDGLLVEQLYVQAGRLPSEETRRLQEVVASRAVGPTTIMEVGEGILALDDLADRLTRETEVGPNLTTALVSRYTNNEELDPHTGEDQIVHPDYSPRALTKFSGRLAVISLTTIERTLFDGLQLRKYHTSPGEFLVMDARVKQWASPPDSHAGSSMIIGRLQLDQTLFDPVA